MTAPEPQSPEEFAESLARRVEPAAGASLTARDVLHAAASLIRAGARGIAARDAQIRAQGLWAALQDDEGDGP